MSEAVIPRIRIFILAPRMAAILYEQIVSVLVDVYLALMRLLRSNKAAKAVDVFDAIDSLDLLRRVERAAFKIACEAPPVDSGSSQALVRFIDSNLRYSTLICSTIFGRLVP